MYEGSKVRNLKKINTRGGLKILQDGATNIESSFWGRGGLCFGKVYKSAEIKVNKSSNFAVLRSS